MSVDSLTIILPLLAVIVAGLLVAGLWFWWTSGDDEEYPMRDPDQTPTSGQSASSSREGGGITNLLSGLSSALSSTSPADDPEPPATFISSSRMARATGDNTVEVLRLLRDLVDGSLVVEIDGQRYRRLADINDPQVGRRFLGNAQALARFARLGEVSVSEDWMQDIPSPPPVTLPSPPSTSSAEPDWQTSSAPSPSPSSVPRRASPEPPEEDDSGSSLLGGLLGRPADDEEKGFLPPLTMAQEIDDLLQSRLARTAVFSGRSIHVQTADDGGVLIVVDDVYYDGVGEVADDEVRAFIQETIRQWEDRQ